jgi:hypothetical protein
MKIQIDRDSVSAGDDFDSHQELRRFEPQMKISAVIYYIIASGFLPRMNKDNASWKVLAGDTELAAINGDCSQIHLFVEPDTELQRVCSCESDARLDFKYSSKPITDGKSVSSSCCTLVGPLPFGIMTDTKITEN